MWLLPSRHLPFLIPAAESTSIRHSGHTENEGTTECASLRESARRHRSRHALQYSAVYSDLVRSLLRPLRPEVPRKVLRPRRKRRRCTSPIPPGVPQASLNTSAVRAVRAAVDAEITVEPGSSTAPLVRQSSRGLRARWMKDSVRIFCHRLSTR